MLEAVLLTCATRCADFAAHPGWRARRVATMALGTGVTAAVFAVVNAVLIRPLPYRDPSRLALVWSVDPQGSRTWLSAPELEDLQRRARAAAVDPIDVLRVDG